MNRRVRVPRRPISTDVESQLREELAIARDRLNTLSESLELLTRAFHDDMLARAQATQQNAAFRRDQIHLETYINNEGFVYIRDVDTKRPIAYVENIELHGIGDANGDFQYVLLKVITDPRARG